VARETITGDEPVAGEMLLGAGLDREGRRDRRGTVNASIASAATTIVTTTSSIRRLMIRVSASGAAWDTAV
jgi:hypothetical protein